MRHRIFLIIMILAAAAACVAFALFAGKTKVSIPDRSRCVYRYPYKDAYGRTIADEVTLRQQDAALAAILVTGQTYIYPWNGSQSDYDYALVFGKDTLGTVVIYLQSRSIDRLVNMSGFVADMERSDAIMLRDMLDGYERYDRVLIPET